jgi:hypothetical protein
MVERPRGSPASSSTLSSAVPDRSTHCGFSNLAASPRVYPHPVRSRPFRRAKIQPVTSKCLLMFLTTQPEAAGSSGGALARARTNWLGGSAVLAAGDELDRPMMPSFVGRVGLDSLSSSGPEKRSANCSVVSRLVSRQSCTRSQTDHKLPQCCHLQVFLCAQVDSNHHPTYTGQGPQVCPYSVGVYRARKMV